MTVSTPSTPTKTPTPTPTPPPTPPPAATPTVAPTPGAPTRANYAVTVRRARSVLYNLLIVTLLAGIAATVVSFFAVNRALSSYEAIVSDSSVSADAAQSARSAILAHHSAAADFVSLQGNAGSVEARARTEQDWNDYQSYLRQSWQNRSDQEFGEYDVFAAADRATWRYRAKVDAMIAFAESGERERAQSAFLDAHTILIRELLPALNGLENVKLESMEEAYNNTEDSVNAWRNTLLFVGGAAVLTLLTGFALTRVWLRYAWTWEILLASVVGIALFLWFNFTLNYAATEVRTLVRAAYDSISGVQSVQSYVTEAEALESMAIFEPNRANDFLDDAQEYLFLAEQRLCGELNCTSTTFGGQFIDRSSADAATAGQSKYGLPDVPLVANAFANDFAGEGATLENLRIAIANYRTANNRLREELTAGQTVSAEQRAASQAAYDTMREAATNEQAIVRTRFYDIYDTVTSWMQLNLWLSALFTVLAILGAAGLRRRRAALYP